jgi:hypothetical protein
MAAYVGGDCLLLELAFLSQKMISTRLDADFKHGIAGEAA